MIINVNRSITKSRKLNNNEKFLSFDYEIKIKKIYKNRSSIAITNKQQKFFSKIDHQFHEKTYDNKKNLLNILLKNKKIDKKNQYSLLHSNQTNYFKTLCLKSQLNFIHDESSKFSFVKITNDNSNS